MSNIASCGQVFKQMNEIMGMQMLWKVACVWAAVCVWSFVFARLVCLHTCTDTHTFGQDWRWRKRERKGRSKSSEGCVAAEFVTSFCLLIITLCLPQAVDANTDVFLVNLVTWLNMTSIISAFFFLRQHPPLKYPIFRSCVPLFILANNPHSDSHQNWISKVDTFEKCLVLSCAGETLLCDCTLVFMTAHLATLSYSCS